MDKDKWTRFAEAVVDYVMSAVYCLLASGVMLLLAFVPRVNLLVGKALHRAVFGR